MTIGHLLFDQPHLCKGPLVFFPVFCALLRNDELGGLHFCGQFEELCCFLLLLGHYKVASVLLRFECCVQPLSRFLFACNNFAKTIRLY